MDYPALLYSRLQFFILVSVSKLSLAERFKIAPQFLTPFRSSVFRRCFNEFDSLKSKYVSIR